MMTRRCGGLALLILLLNSSCGLRENPHGNPSPLPPMTFPGISWEEKSPEDLGVDPEVLHAALDTLAAYCGEDGVEEVAVIRRGYLIHRGDSADKVHGVWSTTKSFTSTILGFLTDQGILTPETRAADLFADLEEHYSGVRLKHFATHTSGYNAVGCNRWHDCADEDWSPTMLAIDTPLFDPGTKFLYYDEAMEMYAKVLTIALDETLEEFLTPRLFDPVGITTFHWPAEYETAAGIPICRGGGDLQLHALDLARFGHLYLNQGMWEDQPLLSEAWVEAATTNQVPLTIGHETRYRQAGDGRGVYGYNFWLNGITADGTRAMPDTPPGTFYASGYNNNMCFVIPEWEMVVVRMGLDGNPPGEKAVVYNRFFRELAKGILPLTAAKGTMQQTKTDMNNEPDPY